MAAIVCTGLYCSKPMAIRTSVSLDPKKRKNFIVSISSSAKLSHPSNYLRSIERTNYHAHPYFQPKNILKSIRSTSSFIDGRMETKESQRYEDLERIAAKDRKIFSFETLDAATTNFSGYAYIGGGGFGSVYKGRLKDGTEIAVKKLSNTTPEGRLEFLKEAEVLTGLQHRNVVKLLGYCVHNNDYLLVYEFLPYCLNQFLSGRNKTKQLDWTQRFDIFIDIAKGLLYLHVDNRDRIVHRDIKPNNILLDQNLMPKIADFGLSRFFPEDQTHFIATNVAGTKGYMPPEYLLHKLVSVKMDVYSFGVLMLELISGQKNSHYIPPWLSKGYTIYAINMLEMAYKLYTKGRSLEFLDPAIADLTITESEQVIKCIEIALLCVQDDPKARPDMEGVITMLTMNHGHKEVPCILKPGILGYNGYRYVEFSGKFEPNINFLSGYYNMLLQCW